MDYIHHIYGVLTAIGLLGVYLHAVGIKKYIDERLKHVYETLGCKVSAYQADRIEKEIEAIKAELGLHNASTMTVFDKGIDGDQS